MDWAEEYEQRKRSRAADRDRAVKQSYDIETDILWDAYLVREINIDVAVDIKHPIKRAIIFSDSFFKQKIVDIIDDSPYFTDEEKLLKKQDLGMQDAVLRVRNETESEKRGRDTMTRLKRIKFKKEVFDEGKGELVLERLIGRGAYKPVIDEQQEKNRKTMREFIDEQNTLVQERLLRMREEEEYIEWIRKQQKDRSRGYDYDR